MITKIVNFFPIIGKTLLLKERCIRTKRRNPGRKLMMISLASTDIYGNPYEVPCVYDVLSEREMTHHQVGFMNAKQLLDDHIKHSQMLKKGGNHKSLVGGEDNLKFVYETYIRRNNGEISPLDMRARIFYNHGIDYNNATEFYNSQIKIGTPDHNNLDVYEMLLAHIKRNPDFDYYIDEMPILINRKCKFFLFTFSIIIVLKCKDKDRIFLLQLFASNF